MSKDIDVLHRCGVNLYVISFQKSFKTISLSVDLILQHVCQGINAEGQQLICCLPGVLHVPFARDGGKEKALAVKSKMSSVIAFMSLVVSLE